MWDMDVMSTEVIPVELRLRKEVQEQANQPIRLRLRLLGTGVILVFCNPNCIVQYLQIYSSTDALLRS